MHVIHVTTVSIVPLWNWNLNLVSVSSVIDESQSYLYGIEIDNEETISNGGYVSIVPLWNWNSNAAGSMTSTKRLNRTFMELKFRRTDWGTEELPVSIVPLWNWNEWADETSFNTYESQSYLYGIEIRRGARGWRHHLRSQSYLYGIEMTAHLRWLTPPRHVSIVPLWNWNNSCSRSLSKSYSVSIVPLWNWNNSRTFLLKRWRSLNRTFMELKFRLGLKGFSNSKSQSYLYGIEIEE